MNSPLNCLCNKHNVQMETGQKCFVNRALRYFLLDLVRDGKSVAKPHSPSEKILLCMCAHTHVSAGEWHVKFLTCHKMGWGNWGMLLNPRAFLTQVQHFMPSFSPGLFSVNFWGFLISKWKYLKCEMFEFQKWINDFVRKLKKKKWSKALRQNRMKRQRNEIVAEADVNTREDMEVMRLWLALEPCSSTRSLELHHSPAAPAASGSSGRGVWNRGSFYLWIKGNGI